MRYKLNMEDVRGALLSASKESKWRPSWKVVRWNAHDIWLIGKRELWGTRAQTPDWWPLAKFKGENKKVENGRNIRADPRILCFFFFSFFDRAIRYRFYTAKKTKANKKGGNNNWICCASIVEHKREADAAAASQSNNFYTLQYIRVACVCVRGLRPSFSARLLTNHRADGQTAGHVSIITVTNFSSFNDVSTCFFPFPPSSSSSFLFHRNLSTVYTIYITTTTTARLVT